MFGSVVYRLHARVRKSAEFGVRTTVEAKGIFLQLRVPARAGGLGWARVALG